MIPQTDWLDVVRRVTPAVAISVLIAAAIVGFISGALIGANQGADAVTPPQAVDTPQSTPTPTPTPETPAISLAADPQQVAPNETIRLSGQIDSGAGDVPLQVERSINGGEWGDFPVSTKSKGDGSFSVRVQTQRTGTVEFRMRAELDGETIYSEAVAVEIG